MCLQVQVTIWSKDPESRALDPESWIMDPESWIQGPGGNSKGLEPGSMILVETAPWVQGPSSGIVDAEPWIQGYGLGSWMLELGCRFAVPGSRIQDVS